MVTVLIYTTYHDSMVSKRGDTKSLEFVNMFVTVQVTVLSNNGNISASAAVIVGSQYFSVLY